MKIHSPLTLILAHFIVLFILKTYGFSIEMIPIDSPKLQILPQNFSAQEKHKYLASMSLSRAYEHRASKNTSKPDSFILQPGHAIRGYYVSSISIGQIGGQEKPYSAYLLLDTASVTTWLQCEGCGPCFKFEGPKFDYRQSETYERMGVNDRECDPRETYFGSCGYTIEYGLTDQGIKTTGIMGRDTFFFGNSKEPKIEAFPGIPFGCGFENKGFNSKRSFVGPKNVISGILGLAPRLPRSFMVQLDSHIKGRFSYCLAPNYRTGFTRMYFGDDAQIRGDDTRKVQKITMTYKKFYYLSMMGISVDGKRLMIDPSIFDPRTSNGVLIDSGSPATVLAKSAFNALSDAIDGYFYKKFGAEPIPYSPTKMPYRICYDKWSEDPRDYPRVIFHFKREGQEGEVDMVMHAYNMFPKIELDSPPRLAVCLAVVRTGNFGPSLLGAYQQTDFRILYDIPNSLLHFIPEICVPS